MLLTVSRVSRLKSENYYISITQTRVSTQSTISRWRNLFKDVTGWKRMKDSAECFYRTQPSPRVVVEHCEYCPGDRCVVQRTWKWPARAFALSSYLSLPSARRWASRDEEPRANSHSRDNTHFSRDDVVTNSPNGDVTNTMDFSFFPRKNYLKTSQYLKKQMLEY